jgi:hypothetical protein
MPEGTDKRSRIEQDTLAIDSDEEEFRRDTERLEHDLEEEHRPVSISVNTKAVRLDKHRVTGQEIKDASIDQGVDIEADFQLFEKRGEDWVQIGDNEEITVRDGAVFRAVSPDDNS